jgi:hypothetical protein
MSRSDIPDVADRRPFYLYVDEFQNFATDSFAVILSEARKYGLNLTVANQYISQMTDSVRDAVFGNVGTTISFRVSADDAPILSKQFEPVFDQSDLIQMNNRHFVISMIINGEKVPAFSATTLSLPTTPQDNFDKIVEASRRGYARTRAEVEAEIRATIEQSEKYKKELSDSGRAGSEQDLINRQINNSYTTRGYGAGYMAGDNGVGNYAAESSAPSKKPVFQYTPTPQADFKKLKLSPNAAEGKERNGLKDLGALVAEKQASQPKPAPKPQQNHQNQPQTTQQSPRNTQQPRQNPSQTRQDAQNKPAQPKPLMDSQKSQKPLKSPENSQKREIAQKSTPNPSSKTPQTSPDARTAARNAESKFLGKVANPKLKATGKAALKATDSAAVRSDHNPYSHNANPYDTGYNSGPRLGSTRNNPYTNSDDNEFTIRH